MRSDNLRIPTDRKQAGGALNMIESTAAGTALICAKGDAYTSRPAVVGSRIKYRALAGEVYDAVVTSMLAGGRVDIDVQIPGAAPIPLTGIKLLHGVV